MNVGEVLSLWAPRMLLGGVEYNDIETVRSLNPSWIEWIDVWSDIGLAHRRLADDMASKGAKLSAGRAYRRAAACYHFSKFVWVENEEKNRIATAAAVVCTIRALGLLDPGFRRVVAGGGEFQIAGNLRVPATANETCALVVLVPGLDSTKEEFPSWEQTYLDRGAATLSIDGPGQGEVFHLGTRMQAAYEKTLALGLVAVSDDPRLDMTRVGLAGTSLGGYYAARGAAFTPQIKALVSVSGPFKVDLEKSPPHSEATTRFYSRSASSEENLRILSDFDLTDAAPRIYQPALIATGRRDRIIPWEQTEMMARVAPHAEFKLYEDGNHGLTNRASEFRDVSADWMVAQLSR